MSGILPDFMLTRRALDGMINPFHLEQVQAASYDVTLGAQVLVPVSRDVAVLKLGESLDVQYEQVGMQDKEFALAPGRFVLGATNEYITLPADLACRIEGKSSLAKAGLQIHSAGLAAPGYRGTLTLEIVNFGHDVIVLRPGVRIAQLIFEQLAAAARAPYQGRYQGATGPQGYVRPRDE